MLDDYDSLGVSDKGMFAKVVNSLLFHTFINLYVFDKDSDKRRTNPEYLFADRNFQLLEEYFDMAGIRLRRDENYGIIFIQQGDEGVKEKFDKLTTQFLYMLRIMYDEERDNLSLSSYVPVNLADVVQRMISLSVFSRKPSNEVLRQIFSRLMRFRIVVRVSGTIEKGDARYLIIPTILFIVPNEKVSAITRMIDESGNEEEESDEEA